MNKMNKYRSTVIIVSLFVIFGLVSKNVFFKNILEGNENSNECSILEGDLKKACEEKKTQAENIVTITNLMKEITQDYNTSSDSNSGGSTDTGLLGDLSDIQNWTSGSTLTHDPKYAAAVSEIRSKMQSLYNALDTHKQSTLQTSSMLTTALENIQGLEEVSRDLVNNETSSLKQQEINKKRIIQNNDYYVNRYKALINIVKMLILFSIIMIFLMYLANKEYLPAIMTEIGMPFIFAIMIFYIFYLYIDIKRRNPINYDEYEFTFIKPSEDE